MVTSEFYSLQLKKGNKEPNPMVQLSIQDVTQESKVRARTSLWKVSWGAGVGAGAARWREDSSWDEVFPLECLQGQEFSGDTGLVVCVARTFDPVLHVSRPSTAPTAPCGRRPSGSSCKTLEARSSMCR